MPLRAMAVPTRRRLRWIAPLLMISVGWSAGCASLAKQPGSPARRVQFTQINQPDPDGARFYLLVFSAQTVPKIPRYTHSWITFVRVRPSPPGAGSIIEQHTISWMPRSLRIRTFRPKIEPGVNLTLHESIQMALGFHERISLWGPYEIPPGMYRKFLIQKEFIESGAIGYQCIDTIGESAWTGRASNCIHAISDSDATFNRQFYPLTYFGDSASLHILRQMVERGAIINPDVKHDWLLQPLGLQDVNILRREYNPPLLPGPIRFGHLLGLVDDMPP